MPPATVLPKAQEPPFLPADFIAVMTFSCKALAHGGCGRFHPIKMPTQIQNRVDNMIFSEAVRCWELGR